MIHPEIRTLLDPDGTPVCNVAFDLSADQLSAASHALGEIVLERHRGADLSVDDVLALRVLTGVRDEVGRLAEGGGHARLTLPVARFMVLDDALDEYVATRAERGWLRSDDEHALPIADAMLAPMAALRGDALEEALSAADAAAPQ